MILSLMSSFFLSIFSFFQHFCTSWHLQTPSNNILTLYIDRYRNTTAFVNDVKSYFSVVVKAVTKITNDKAGNGASGAPSGGLRAAARAAESAREKKVSVNNLQNIESSENDMPISLGIKEETIAHVEALQKWIESVLLPNLHISKMEWGENNELK